MKKLTKQDVERIGTKPPGRASKVRIIVSNMLLDEIVLLERTEWKEANRAPSVMLRKLEKQYKRKFTCAKALDGSGWIVERVG